MARIGSLMSMGQQAMANSQTSLQTTSHNITNANTEGYTRQRVEQVTNEPTGTGRIRLGHGAKTSAVKRITNDYITKQINLETSKLGTATGKQDSLMRVEQVFNESINKGLNHFLGDFFNAFREFSNNPESQATRALVKENAKTLAENFHRIDGQLDAIQKDIDFQIHANLSQINGMGQEIANLNEKIHQVEAQGAQANDERDRRDLLVKKLGELVNIRSAEGDNGKFSITVGNTAVLVSGSEYNQLYSAATPGREGKREANYDVMFKIGDSKVERLVTGELKGGVIGGLIEVRDQVINGLHTDLDHIAFTVSDAVNAVHSVGFDKYNQTGTVFFNPLDVEFGAATSIQVNDKILKDPGRIASGLQPDAPGDNRVANAIAELQERKILKNGASTVDDFFNGMVGEYAILTQKNNMIFEHQKNIVAQLNNVRESVSGVSLDEEVADMVKFQKTFDASARLIRTADEMFDTVLNLKRM